MKRAYSWMFQSLLTVAAAVMLLSPAGDRGKAWGAGLDSFIGSIDMVAFNFAPQDWATCDGQIMSIAQNSALFALLGTTYGGDGRTTFALPDLRGRVAIHQGQGPGLSYHGLGDVGGSETVNLTTAQMPIHTHTANTTVSVASSLMANSGNGTTDNPAGNAIAKVPREFQYSTSAPNVSMRADSVITTASATTSVGPEGSSQPVGIMPPYLTVNYVICLYGIFPSRN